MPGDKLKSTLLIDGLKAYGRVETAWHIINPVIQQSDISHEPQPIPQIAHASLDNHKLPQPQRLGTPAFVDPLRHAVHDQVTQIDH